MCANSACCGCTGARQRHRVRSQCTAVMAELTVTAMGTGTGQPWWQTTYVAALIKRFINMSEYSERSRRLLTAMRTQLSASFPLNTAQEDGRHRLLDCPVCEGFMPQPLCFPCGHSICKTCIDRTLTGIVSSAVLCPICRRRWPRTPPGCSGERCPTLVLQNVLAMWYPKWVDSCMHREEGNRFAEEGDFPIAISWYCKAMETGVCVLDTI